jgi:uncharacterized membrane protein
MTAPAALTRKTSTTPGILLGLGLGGFVDGILFHQILQWHNMGSAKVPPVTMEAMRQNMRWDGLLHAAVWLLTTAGVYLLLRDARRRIRLPTERAFTGLLVLGWGLFNLVEGIVDHHLFGLHHVRDLPVYVSIYDWLFLLIGGVGFIALGSMLLRISSKTEATLDFRTPAR